MRIYKPSENPITQGYSSKHPAYDFAGLNLSDEVKSGKDGEIIERVDLYTTNWKATIPLTTKDYGNFIKVKHNDGTFALFAHLRKGSSFVKGTQVKEGQTIARIGNTGNSTGKHLHAEYRNASNVNQPAEFYSALEDYTKALDDNNTDNIPVERSKLEDFERVKTGWNQVREKLNVEDNVTVVVGEVDKLIGFQDAVLQKDKQLVDASAKITKLGEDLKGLKKVNDQLVEENNNLGQEVGKQGNIIEKQEVDILSLKDNIEKLKQDVNVPILTGWRRIILKILEKL